MQLVRHDEFPIAFWRKDLPSVTKTDRSSMSDRAEKLVEVLTALSMAEALPRGTVKEDVIKTRAHVELSRETLGRLLKDMRSELFDVQSLPNEPFTDFLKREQIRSPLCREDCERFHIYLSEVLADPEYDSKDRARPLLKSINARLKRIENKSAAVVEVKHDAGSPKLPEQAKKSSSKKRAAAEMTTEEKKDVRRKLQRRWRNAKSLEKKTELDTEIRALDVEIAGLKISEALPGTRLAHAKTEQARLSPRRRTL